MPFRVEGWVRGSNKKASFSLILPFYPKGHKSRREKGRSSKHTGMRIVQHKFQDELSSTLICIDPVKSVQYKLFESSYNVLVAERTAYRWLISLICAGWLPHDNRFVGELPRSSIEDHIVAGRLLV
jgi:hypothetical protein